ncbi:flavin reductase family protein [Desulfosporosinus fructosivorans]|uniref:Flavin reductase family protein n=1 Tax=Desulfosporosinus fructosivorans TaxID=2018669 RepID=A0A4Z0R6G0_9FIRM|nr:flavin reductase family protein [Desulfosporosinus fructosivorans]TGE37547.1 flavin reductase family protein [Desulfosporosinus fructosivorans]
MDKIKLQNRPFGPFPTVLVGAAVNGKPNYATLGAYGVVSMKPVLYISLKSTHHTTMGVKETGYFSVNIPSADLVQKTDYCGMVSGKTIDKSNVFTSFYDDLGKAPMISECPINYLCKVIQTIPIFDFEMFLGEIVAVYANENCLKDGRPDPIKINPIIMMDTSYCDLNHVVGTIFKVGQSITD